jgi:type IV pilus assembly protein PilM
MALTDFRFENPIAIAPGGRPAAACEITPEGVVAAATSAAGQPPVYTAEPLPALAVTPGLEANLLDPPAISAALKAALGKVQPRVRSVTLVVPDAAVRVFVLDFDTLPSRQDEAVPVLRFRLRKSVPFDVEDAGISYQVLSEGSARLERQWKVLAAVMPGPVLGEYEAVVRGAGYEPGAVLPASLAAIAALSAEETHEAMLIVNLAARSMTATIVSGNDILLYRTVELPREADELRAEVQRSIAVAMAFYEDTLQVRPHRILYSGVLSVRDFTELVDDAELAIGELVARPEIGLTSAMGQHPVAGVTGALAGTN